MALIDVTSCETSPVKRQQLIRTDRLGVILIFAGAVVFHLAILFNLLPSV